MNTEEFINKNIECIICFDLIDIEQQNIKIFEDCEHYNNYHYECINIWINDCNNKNLCPSCPICRNKLNIVIDTSILNTNNQNNIFSVQLIYFKNYCYKTVCTISIIISMYIIFQKLLLSNQYKYN